MGTRQLPGNHLSQAGEILELPISGMCSPAGLWQGQTGGLRLVDTKQMSIERPQGSRAHEVHCTLQSKEMKRVFISLR